MNKRIRVILGALVLVCFMSAVTITVFAGTTNEIRVRFDGEYVDINPVPVIVRNRTLVPESVIAELFGAIVECAPFLEQQFTITVGYIRLDMSDIDFYGKGQNVVWIGEVDAELGFIDSVDYVEIDVSARIIDGVRFIPLRFVAETLGFDVDFQNGVVIITSILNVQK